MECRDFFLPWFYLSQSIRILRNSGWIRGSRSVSLSFTDFCERKASTAINSNLLLCCYNRIYSKVSCRSRFWEIFLRHYKSPLLWKLVLWVYFFTKLYTSISTKFFKFYRDHPFWKPVRRGVEGNSKPHASCGSHLFERRGIWYPDFLGKHPFNKSKI